MCDKFDQELDAQGLACPLPLLKTKMALSQMQSGQVLKVIATDAGSERDIAAFARLAGHVLLKQEQQAERYLHWLKKA